MKYIIKNDLYDIFVKKKKYLFTYMLLIILTIFILRILKYEFNKDLLFNISGMNFNLSENTLYILLFLFHLTFYVFLSIYSFTKDMYFGLCNIFLRISSSGWLKYKVISMTISLIFIKTISYFIYFSFFKDIISIDIFIFDICFFMLVISISYAMYIILKKNKFIFFLILICMFLLLWFYGISYVLIKKYIFLIIISNFIIYILTKKIFKKVLFC